MNETLWAACTDPVAMLDHLEGRASPRKFRLFACGNVRRYWAMLKNRLPREAVELAERLADEEGVAVEAVRDSVDGAAMGAPFFEQQAWMAAAAALLDSPSEAARTVSEMLRQQAVRDASYESMPGEDETRISREASADERARQCALIREIFGDPFRTVAFDRRWLLAANGIAPVLARRFYDERRFDELPYLGDALTDGGCTDEAMLSHLATSHGHCRGCWALDAVLGLE